MSLIVALVFAVVVVARPQVAFGQLRAAPIPIYTLTACIGNGAYCLSSESIYRPLNVAGVLVFGPRSVLWTWYSCPPDASGGRCRR